jgi:hypothetical protein
VRTTVESRRRTADNHSPDVSTPTPGDPLDPAWKTLLSDWENDVQHRRFVALATTMQRLPDAAKRYREALADPSRQPRAQQGIDRVLGAAMATLTPPPREARPRLNVMLPLGAFAGVLLLTILASHATGFRALTSPIVIFGEALIVALIPWRRIGAA